jgi:hypothetical protein
MLQSDVLWSDVLWSDVLWSDSGFSTQRLPACAVQAA